MTHCPVCSTELPNPHAPCPVCLVTKTSAPPSLQDQTKTSAPISHREFLATVTHGADPIDVREGEYRYMAGDLLADRFRIVAPLGKGGMGEVYRADDLSLGVSVALKILPERIATNAIWLTRFRKEVAAARQVSHPHVCRVYDITEANGQSLLSMEFIAGDDLAAVLRKIGRLSSELAIDLTRQIAQGLHAVHDEGLIHRDLKPANIMIDGRGRAKLSDFGLATAASSVTGNDIYAGTPVYQAPEQLAGETLTERTDLYALGVLAYELLTGRRPVLTTDRDELILAQKRETPAPPSTFDASIPPEVDRIILKCLSYDPLKRPASAHEVWRTLPGDAALNAALAAGQTPTVDEVADAGGEGRLTRRTALLLAASVLMGIAAMAIMKDDASQLRMAGTKSPSELQAAAVAHLRTLGPGDHVVDTADGFDPDFDFDEWLDVHDRSADRLDGIRAGRPSGVFFWYRESPIPMLPQPRSKTANWISISDPPGGVAGSAVVRVDARGRLDFLSRVPPAGHVGRGGEPNWAVAFAAAGLDPNAFHPTEPDWKWDIPHERRLAWAGKFPERPNVSLRVEAAADRGEVVGFRLVAPWTARTDDVFIKMQRATGSSWILVFVINCVSIVGGVVLTIGHIRRGRADVRGGTRLALAFGAIHLTYLMIMFRPFGTAERDIIQLFGILARVLLNAGLVAGAYMALEPFVRRRWPGRLIGWSRLLAGRPFDPRVGREVLIGVATGLAGAICYNVGLVGPGWFGLAPQTPGNGAGTLEYGAARLIGATLAGIDTSLFALLSIFLLSWVLRTRWLWVPAAVLLWSAAFAIGPSVHPVMTWLAGLATVGIGIASMLRFGLLTSMSGTIALLLVHYDPVTYDINAWYFPVGLTSVLAVVALTVFGLVTSVGGWQRLWKPETQL